MLNIFFYFYLMFMMFMVSFIVSAMLYYNDYMVIVEWNLVSFNSFNLEIILYIDWLAMLFISFILLISSMVLLYSYMYMMSSSVIFRFIYLVVLFVVSMIIMIISPNVVSILFGWDGLGLVSYCLVIFYQNNMSYNSGMVTVLCNRIGDVGLLLCISLMVMKGSWNLWMFEVSAGDSLMIFMLVLAAITKSAQIPFSTWLPMAMAAPTPVSALVHSSTLVTAGVYLMIRFNKFLLGASLLSTSLLFLSVLTMFMAGLIAMVENDLKKIIALSTLSQLGLMMMILSVGAGMVAFYHLLTHAIFKSMLFMCAGIIIHSMGDNQDIRTMGKLNLSMPFTMMSFLIASLALSGFPFLAGFYSKDYVMELIYLNQMNLFILLLVILSLMLTVMYSIRLFYYLFYKNISYKGIYLTSVMEDKIMCFSLMMLFMMSIIVGALLNWLFFFDFYLVYLSFDVKMITLSVCVIGVILGGGNSALNFMGKFFYLGYYFNSMLFMNYLYLWVYSPVNFLGVKMYELDNSWVEFFFKKLVLYFSLLMNSVVVMYKMYIYMGVLISGAMLILLL